MSVLIDLTGERFGRWVVLRQEPSNKHGHTRWLCQCDCGKRGVVTSGALKAGKSRSCGCLQVEHCKKMGAGNALLPGEAACNDLYKKKAGNAKARGLIWALSREQFEQLTSSPCRYCGAPPFAVHQPKGVTTPCVHGGIDRIDSSVGYLPDNCAACCKWCNFAKHARSPEAFLAWARRLVYFQEGLE